MNIMKTDSTDFHSCLFFTPKTSRIFCSGVFKVLKLNNLLVLIFQIYSLFWFVGGVILINISLFFYQVSV